MQGIYLYDDKGVAYLDCVNNVCHVGHCHPKIVEACCNQISILNTNTRYLHPNIVTYASRLAKTMGHDSLEVVYIVNSGSEANDLALRLARTYTKKHDIICIDAAYHGNTSSLIEISPYKYEGAGGFTKKEYVHKVSAPDIYRGQYKDIYTAGSLYAKEIETILQQNNNNIAAFIAESVLGCGGQIVLPSHYLRDVYKYIHASGGVCIADEVQVGFGRVGTHYWGFQTQDVIPDIVTIGKPAGNGFPLAAVVCTREIAEAFNNG